MNKVDNIYLSQNLSLINPNKFKVTNENPEYKNKIVYFYFSYFNKYHNLKCSK